MAYPRKSFRGDEELGKKYDDLGPVNRSSFRAAASLQFLPRRPRRALFGVLGLVLLVLFIKNIQSDRHSTIESVNGEQTPPKFPPAEVAVPVAPPEDPPGAFSPQSDENIPAPYTDYYYNEPVKFYALSKSLNVEQGSTVSSQENNVVVFAAASLKSVSDLLPLACDMARNEFNRVHFAVMGRHRVSIKGLKVVNGISDAECPLVWHDGRPDYGPWSTGMRMKASVKAALGHIARSSRPRVVITHDEQEEELYFWEGITRRAGQMRLTHIGLSSRASDFKWIAKLDSNSLQAWNQVQVDILVHAPSQSVGGLVRLLKSLQSADYFGSAPTLTIELPSDVDPPLLKYLSAFKWPPYTQRRDFTLRRRLQSHHPTPEEVSIRAMDAVYPKHPQFSHVLVLSPQADLTPSYYHYLIYSLLKYRYSAAGAKTAGNLLGISLELPSSSPTDGEALPYLARSRSSSSSGVDDIPQFLWQLPNNKAALYFGDKWIEFQSFLSNRFSPSLKPKQKQHPNLMMRSFPAWMEYMLEFIRARGYYLLFPAFAVEDDLALVSVDREPTRNSEQLPAGFDGQESQLDSAEKVLSESSTISTLLHTYPGELPDLPSLQLLSYRGDSVPYDDWEEQTEAYWRTFMTDVGGCGEGRHPPAVEPLKADDLFCMDSGS